MRRALLLLLVLLPSVMAQGGPGQATVTLTAEVDELIVSKQGPETFRLTVALESDNPFDQLQDREIRMERVGTLPDGWIIQVMPERQSVGAGESVSFTVQVDLTQAAQDDALAVGFKAILVPRGAEDTPLGDALDPETESNVVSVNLVREDPLGTEVLQGLGPWVWVGLGVLAIAVLVLVFLLASGSRPTVSLTSNVTNATVAPGRSVAVPVKVKNLTRNEDTVVFHVARVQEGWAASLPVPELLLDGNAHEELHLVVTAPKSGVPGDQIRIGMSASSAQNPKRVAELVVDVTVGDTIERSLAGDTTPADVIAERRKKA